MDRRGGGDGDVRKLIVRYPDFYAGSAEFVDLQEALEPEVLALWEYRDSVLDQLSVDTATWGLRYWEQTLGIPVEAAKDLSFRRSRIKSKLRGAGITTVAMIQNVAESFSNGEVAVREFPTEFRVEIVFVGTIGIPPNMEDLTAALREAMPAHLKWDYIIIYNTWDNLKLCLWEKLAAKTWREVKESDLHG